MKNEKGLTAFEVLISISVGSVVLMMLMSILSTTLVSRNYMEHENRLLNESYHISEYLQASIFDLGVRSIEEYAEEDEDHQILILSHEFDVSYEEGVLVRDYVGRSFVLHYDRENRSLHYGNADHFDFENRQFFDPAGTRINSTNVKVDPEGTNIRYTCVSQAEFQDDLKCASAFIELEISLTYEFQDKPVFQPKTYRTTIVF